ncbi:MAG: MerR family transcriptional regulator [Coriobacteriales bacterium]|nr:MerR family transcriptional regulator [Coriobacteriales bacterium]
MEKTSYSVKQVAEMSGMSIRALHHFEELGLLQPQRLSNGYRAYSSQDIDRLQQILLYRACGMELKAIKQVLDDPAFNVATALTHHLEALTHERDRLDAMITTVQKTIWSIQGGTTMTDAEKFEGLKQEAVRANEKAYGAEARKRYGDKAIDEANKKLLAMDEAEWKSMNDLEQAIIEQLIVAQKTGDPTSEAAQRLANMHQTWIRMRWANNTYSKEAHLALAQGYLADQRFCDYYDSRAGEGATKFLVEALQNNI